MTSRAVNVVAVSDTHTIYDFSETPDGDLLVIAGDILMRGDIGELRKVMSQLGAESHRWKHILLVPGNHDFALESFVHGGKTWEEYARDVDIKEYPKNMTISHKGFVEILGITIMTWSYVPKLTTWAFYQPGELFRAEFESCLPVPPHVDMVVSHGPPYGILDWIPRVGAVGSKSMENAFNFPYDYHIFGHIHEGAGTTVRDRDAFIRTNNKEYRRYYNVTMLDKHYTVQYEPTTFEII